MFPLAKRFPQGCKVRRSPSAHSTFAEQEKRQARGNEAEKEFRVPCGSNSQKREGCEEQKVIVTTVLHGGVLGWFSSTWSSLCLVPFQLLHLKRWNFHQSFFGPSVQR